MRLGLLLLVSLLLVWCALLSCVSEFVALVAYGVGVFASER